MSVFLCGSFRNDWQNKVIKSCPEHTYFNPKDFLHITDPKIYICLNLKAIQECDIVFSYLESDNPTPINITLEATYGHAIGKKLILCSEWKAGQPTWFKPRYMAQLEEISDYFTDSFEEAISYLSSVSKVLYSWGV